MKSMWKGHIKRDQMAKALATLTGSAVGLPNSLGVKSAKPHLGQKVSAHQF